MENKKEPIRKTAFANVKNKFVTVTLPLSFFAVILFVSLIVGILFPISLIISVPFLILPALFALTAVNTIADTNQNHEGLGFFVMFKTYFNGMFRGGYKTIFGFLKALLVYFVTFSVFVTVIVALVLYRDISTTELMNLLETTTNPEEITNLVLEIIQNNEFYLLTMRIGLVVSLVGAATMFVHHISVHSVKYFYNFLTKAPIPAHDLNIISKETMKKIKKPFRKDYYSCVWFLLLIFLVGTLGFSLLSLFIIKDISEFSAFIIGLFGGSLLCLFFLPYYMNAIQLIYKKYAVEYSNTFVKLSLETLEEFKKKAEIDAEQEKKIREFLESQQKENEENDEEK